MTGGRGGRLAAVILICVLGGCQTQPGPRTGAVPAASTQQASGATSIPMEVRPEAVQAGPPRISGPVKAQSNSLSEPLVQMGRDNGVGASPRNRAGAEEGGDITLNFADTDIREVVRSILGGILKVNYTIDPNVHGTASFETTTPLPRSAMIPTLNMLLNQNGATVVQRDGTYWILPSNMAASAGALPDSGAATTGSEVIPLRYASAQQLAKVLEPYTADTGRIAADPSRNALLVSGDGGARASLIALIRSFDIDILANQSYALFPVSSGEPVKAAQELQKVLATEGEGRLAGLVRVVPMERTNAVLVISSQPRYIADVRRLFRLLDKAESITARRWYVYYVQNGDAQDLERLLQRAFTPGRGASQSDAGATAPGLETASLSSQPSSGFGSASGSGTGSGSASTLTSTTAPGFSGTQGASQTQAVPGGSPVPAQVDRGRAASESLSSDLEEDSQAAKGNRMRIIASRRSNALLIYATADEYSVVESMLAKVDVVPLQVLIEATIAEVTLNDALQYGTQFYFKNGGLNGILSTATNVPITQTGPSVFGGTYPGFVLNKTSGAVKAALSALQDVTQVKVLSSPQILVLDNEKAQLTVGDQVPILTQQSTATTTTPSQIVSNIDYHSTGVILQVVPRVNSGGLVTLEISQEVSDVTKTTSSTINSPTFSERKVTSRVVVQDGQTIGLAGLIRDTASQDNSGVPFLKDIPLLGSLVSNQNNTRTRTELLILLTPKVVHDQRDARALTEDMRRKLGNADGVPADKAHQTLSGSPNPNADFVP